ncbi:MAG: hypothetical protein O3A37_04640 [Planctomycetota bacterium]|nr:hypothetical protein [Planctomycetota bacterium]
MPPISLSPQAIQHALMLAVATACATAVVGGRAAVIDDPCDGHETTWSLATADALPNLLTHDRSAMAARRGTAGERFIFDASAGTTLTVQVPIGAAAAIDEFGAEVWVRANRPGIRIAARVQLPHFQASASGRPVETLVPGSSSRDIGRWQRLTVADLPVTLQRQLPALHAQHGPQGSLAGAVVTHIVLELYSAPGRYDVAIDDLRVEGVIDTPIAIAGSHRDPAVQPALAIADSGQSMASQPPPPQDPVSGLNRGVLEVNGLPFFPRAIDHNGEPLEQIAALGFNCVRLRAPASGNLIEEARKTNVWLICPPPALPHVDVRDPDSMPLFSSNWDRVLMWDMGDGLAEANVEELAERGRRVRACDPRAGRPLIASADSGVRSISRHVDMAVARRTVLGTSLELLDYQTWLRERPRLMRPGTPLLASLSTELDPRTARQAAALAGIGGGGLAVDPESLALAATTCVAAGARGILCVSSRRIDGNDAESRTRAVAVQAMNLRLKILEPWAAAGRFAAAGQTSDSEVQTAVIEAARARVLLAWRCVQGSQIVARHYHGDVPGAVTPLTLLVPGVPEAHRAWEIGPAGLRPLQSRRVTGGVSVTLENFYSQALVLFSSEPTVTAHMQEQVRELAPLVLASARARAAGVLAAGGTLLGRLPPTALGTLPAANMLAVAQQDALEGESLLATDPATAVAKFHRAIAIGSQVERLAWERGVLATGSMVASPLSASDATLAEHWRFIEALVATSQGPTLLPGGSMEQLDALSGSGWRHFASEDPAVRTAVEISRGNPFAGAGCLTIRAVAANPAEPPVVLETPPVWITTPPLSAPPGKLVEIEAQVAVDEPLQGSVDGLLVFDSLGGPALAERVGRTKGWRRLVLYRIVPADTTEPLVVTFAMTGLGTARLDEVAIRVIERGRGGTPASIVSTGPAAPPGSAVASPSDLLGPAAVPQQPLPPLATPSGPAEASDGAWPGMNLAWPKLPFASPNAPPPGPGGGTVDPFKRARG